MQSYPSDIKLLPFLCFRSYCEERESSSATLGGCFLLKLLCVCLLKKKKERKIEVAEKIGEGGGGGGEG